MRSRNPDRQRRAFLGYIERHRQPVSFIDSDGLNVGEVVRDTGSRLYQGPRGFGLPGYHHSTIKNQIALVDPVTHRLVQIIDC